MTDIREYMRARTGVPDENGCWPWVGPQDSAGYGGIRAKAPHRGMGAHRVAYELAIGPVPAGLQLDHLCHTRSRDCGGGTKCPHRKCVNPAHLEPVTRTENTRRGESFSAVNARKTHCDRGHEFTESNTYRWRNSRICRVCKVANRSKRKSRSKRCHVVTQPGRVNA